MVEVPITFFKIELSLLLFTLTFYTEAHNLTEKKAVVGSILTRGNELLSFSRSLD